MKSDRMLELRVLTGVHAGASALLAAHPQWVGSDEDCALILTDAGVLAQQARIEPAADGTVVLRWHDDSQPPLVLRAGQSAWVGPIQIAIETLGAPWCDDLPLASPLQASLTDAGASASTQSLTRRQRLAVWAAVTLTLAGVIGAGFFARSMRVPAEPVPAAKVLAPRATDEPLTHLITRLGLGGRATIDASDPHAPGIRTTFLSAPEVEAIGNELFKRSQPIRLTVVDEAQAVAQVTQSIERAGSLQGVSLTAHHLGGGKFRVEGQVAEEAQRSQIAADLKDSLTQVTDLDVAIRVQAQAARAMVEALKREGIAQVQGQWADGLLTLEVRVPAGALARWETALMTVAARHDVPFRANTTMLETASSVTTAQLPFTLRSVVTTPVPFIVLADGRKVAAGASVEGWRLVAVDPRTVRFEGPLGKQLTLER